MKSSPSIWHLLHNVKSTVKISSIFVAFLENMNFKNLSLTKGQLISKANSKVFIWTKNEKTNENIFVFLP